MLIRPGRLPRAATDDTLVDLLLGCHARIRRFTAMAIALTEPAAAARPLAEIAEAADAVRRYLAVALPLHIADEDEAIAPRLLAHQPDLAPALARMHAEHEAHAPLLAGVIDLCADLARSPADLATLAPRLAPLAADLAAALIAHVDEEERVVIPAVATLPAADQAAIVSELRARRAD